MLSFRTRGNFIDLVNIDNTSLQVESVLMSLHNTSKAIDWSYGDDTTRISFTIDDAAYDGVLITDIDFDGTPMAAQTDFKTNIETMFPGLAGGGAGGGLLSATVTLTDAQIKALPTTPVQVLAAPGAGKYYKIFGAQIITDTSAAAYTNVSASGLITVQLSDSNQNFSCNNGILEEQDVFYGDLAPDTSLNVSPLSNTENNAINISSVNSGGDYTGGNAANTLEVVVYYIIVDL